MTADEKPISAHRPSGQNFRPGRLLLPVLLILLAVTLWLTGESGPFGRITYFETAVSLARDGDLFLVDLNPRPAQARFLTVRGHAPRQHPFGRGLLAWPSVRLGRRLQPFLSSLPGMSNGQEYLTAWYNLPGLLAALTALAVLWLIARTAAPPAAAGLGLLGVFLGTHLHRAVWISQGGTEGTALLFWAAILWLSIRIAGSADFSPERAICLGVLCGMATLIRLQSVIWLIPPLAVWISLVLRPRAGRGKLIISALLLFLCFFLAFAPQLLVWKCWYGRWLPNTYGQFSVREPVTDILAVWVSRARFFTHTPLVWLSLLGLFFSRRRRPAITAAGFAMLAANLAFALVERGFIENQNIAGRHFLVLAPFYVLGLSEIARELISRRKTWLWVTFAIIVIFSFLQVSAFNGPDYFREEGYGWRELGDFSEYLLDFPPLLRVPRSSLGPVAGLLLLPAAAAVFGAAWWCERRPGRLVRCLTAGVVCLAAVNIAVTVAAVARTEEKVKRLEAEGFFRDRWRTLSFNWGIFVDDTRSRALSYLRAGDRAAAERFFELSMLIHPGRYWPDFPELMARDRERDGIPGHLWQGLADRHRRPAAVSGVAGADWVDRAALLDGDLETIGRAERFSSSPPSVTISLDRRSGPLSDLVVVFQRPDVLDRLRVDISSDGRDWEEPLATQKWLDTLWIWDFYQRSVRYVRITGFFTPEEAAIREVIPLFSPRHSVAGEGGGGAEADE